MKLHHVTEYIDANESINDVNMSGSIIKNANLSGVAIKNCRLSGLTINGVAYDDLLKAYHSSKNG